MRDTAERSLTNLFGRDPVHGEIDSPAGSGYAIGRDPAERGRLRRQSSELSEHAEAVLDRVGLRPGQRAIDVGCGPSGILDLLSDRVGESGEVIGLDSNHSHATAARALALDRGLANVQILERDPRRTGLSAGSFDLVHARLLLVNIPRPIEVLSAMVRLAKPGQWVTSQEPDPLFLCEPPHPARDRLSEVFQATYRHEGADVRIGRRLPGLFRESGLVDVGVEVHADHHTAGDTRHTVIPDLVRSMRTKIIEHRLATRGQLDTLDDVVRAHLDQPGTMTLPHLLFTVWGRRPDER